MSATATPAAGTHHAAQRAIVRMLYDRHFAEAVRRDPIGAGLAPEVARLVGGPAGIDPRALRADALRIRRTLGTLVEEWRASSILALDESRSIALLEGFFSSPEFHNAVEEEAPLVLAYGRFLEALVRSARLRGPWLPEVIALESLQARARREVGAMPPRDEGAPPPERVRLAPGVAFGWVVPGALQVTHAVDQLLFEQSLVTGSGLAIDGPRLRLPPHRPDALRMPMVAVVHGGGLSLVTIDEETRALLEPLHLHGPLAPPRLLEEAERLELSSTRAEVLLVELLDQEVLCAASPPEAQ